jgi:20S proteasome subunit beta 6
MCRADKCVLASSGFQGDIKALHKNLAARELVKITTKTQLVNCFICSFYHPFY